MLRREECCDARGGDRQTHARRGSVLERAPIGKSDHVFL